MPYIPQCQRPELERKALGLGKCCKTGGELNFAITKIIQGYITSQVSNPNYEMLSSMLGHLEAVKLEFYRRVIAPYEQKKKAANGDVY